MNLETAAGMCVENATEEDIEKAFIDEATRGEFVQLLVTEGGSIQAADNGEGQFTLEYVDAAGQMFSASEDSTESEARAALADYLRGGTAWRESREWTEEKAGTGCLPVVLLGIPLLLCAAFVWLRT